MPRRLTPPWRLESLGPENRKAALAGRCQEHWYRLAAQRVSGLSVLDVGAGDGYGLPILIGGGASKVLGIDPAPSGPDVRAVPVEAIGSRSFDAVVAMDVIEHVGWSDEDAEVFLEHLLCVACRWVFFSTPNYDYHKCKNQYHAREYTATELTVMIAKVAPHCTVETWTTQENNNSLPVQRSLMDADAFSTNFGVFVCNPL